MHYSFHEQIVLITGGTSGIGLASAHQFVAAGAQVLIVGRDPHKGRAAQQALGEQALFLRCDLSRPEELRALFETIATRFGRLNCAVNAAALDVQPARLEDIDDEAASVLLQTDVFAPFQCMKQEIALLRKAGGGAIVNLSSVNGLSGVANAALYAAGRHAVLGLTRSAAREYIGEGIRINAVCPGATDTPRRQRRMQSCSDEQRAQITQALVQQIPAGRMAQADEIAAAVLWLCSPAASYVVGHCLVVDGGLSA